MVKTMTMSIRWERETHKIWSYNTNR